MTPLTLLDVDRLSEHDRSVLGWIMAAYQIYPVAIYRDRALYCLAPVGLATPFLTVVARDVPSIYVEGNTALAA